MKGEHKPGPACVINGEPWWNWLFEYDWDGATYGFSICARTEAEARERLKRLPLARFLGQQDGNDVSVMSPRGWLIPLTVWWRNRRRTSS